MRMQSNDFTGDYYKPNFGFSPLKKPNSSSPEKKGFRISQTRTGGFEGVNTKTESIFDKMVIDANKKLRQSMDTYNNLGSPDVYSPTKNRSRVNSLTDPVRLRPKTIQEFRKISLVTPNSNLAKNAHMSLQEIAEDRSRLHQSVLSPTVNKLQVATLNKVSSIEKNLV